MADGPGAVAARRAVETNARNRRSDGARDAGGEREVGAMTHPKHEELAEFLYEDGLSPNRHAEVARHVDACDECRAVVDGWRGVRTNLAAWQLPTGARMPVAASRPSTAGARL